MMKVWLTATRSSLVNVSKAGLPLHESINTLRVACFSYVSHNNEHNVGAPPPRSPPKVHISVDNPNHNTTTREDDRHKKTEDVTGFVADKAKKGTEGVVETAFNAGAAVAEGMEKSWGGIKETTEKIKDSVLGNDDDNEKNNNYRGHQSYVDKNIEDLRRKAAGYDQRSH